MVEVIGLMNEDGASKNNKEGEGLKKKIIQEDQEGDQEQRKEDNSEKIAYKVIIIIKKW